MLIKNFSLKEGITPVPLAAHKVKHGTHRGAPWVISVTSGIDHTFPSNPIPSDCRPTARAGPAAYFRSSSSAISLRTSWYSSAIWQCCRKTCMDSRES